MIERPLAVLAVMEAHGVLFHVHLAAGHLFVSGLHRDCGARRFRRRDRCASVRRHSDLCEQKCSRAEQRDGLAYAP